MPMQPFEIRQEIDLKAVNLPMRYEQPLHKGNKNAHRWRVTVKDGVADADLSGAEATLWLTHYSDGSDMSAIANATIDGNTVQVLFPAGAYAQAGEAIAVLEIVSGEMTLGAAVLTLRVMDTKSDVVIDEDDLIPDIGAIQAELASMRAATKEVNAALEMIGPAAEAAEQAKNDAGQAVEDAQRAILATQNWGNVTVTVSMLLPNELPEVTLSDTETGKTMAFALPRGLTGLTPNLRIGTVTTLSEGEKASATITGTAEAPVLNLAIPRGYTGSLDNMPFYTGLPSSLGGEASPGTSEQVARGDHVHPMPTAEDVGALGSTEWLDKIYPVGSIYMSANSTSPASLFGGGTWEQIKGRFLFAAGSNSANSNSEYGGLDANAIDRSAGETGGQVRHTLTANELPKTTGSIKAQYAGGTIGLFNGATGVFSLSSGTNIGGTPMSPDVDMNNTSRYHTVDFAFGGGSAHNIMPPYLVVYMWKRVS